MIIIPAIDLYQRQCVRLQKGDFNEVTIYHQDAIACAQQYQQQGASNLHVVDLMAAKGECAQRDIIREIKQATTLCLQAGGGLRDLQTISDLLDQGIDRVVLGSLAVLNPDLVKNCITEYGVQRVVLALDVRIDQQPMVAIQGWQQETQQSLSDVLTQYQALDGLTVLCTDINRDGMLVGPNLDLYRQGLQQFPQFNWQASGGVSSLQDLSALQEIGMNAVIIGKALYEQRFSLTDALAQVMPC